MIPDGQAPPRGVDPGLRSRLAAALGSDPLAVDLLARWDRWGADLLEGLAAVYLQPGVAERIVDLTRIGSPAP